jgi:MFS transporter, MHS family, proline/betaine transporter
MTGSTVAFAALPTYAQGGLLAPALLLGCRVLQGLSVSAEATGAQLLLLEHAGGRARGGAVGFNNGARSLGAAAAATVALVARLLTPDQLAGWRAIRS